MKNISYYLKEGVANLFTNKIVTLTTTITVIVSLLILGIFNIISFNVVHISNDLGNNFEFNIFIKDSVSEGTLEQIGQDICNIENVKSAEKKMKSETLKEVKKKFSDGAAIQKLSEKDNPFRNSFKVTLKDISKSEETINEIKKIPQVDSVSNNVETSKKLDKISKKVKVYSIIAYIILSLLCLSIVSNIINVSIFSRRKHINIMKYVGATNHFIRVPFVIEGILIGLIGAVVSCLILFYGYYCLFGNLNHVINQITLIEPKQITFGLIVSNVCYGFIIGALGASFAVNKHLKV